MFAAAPQANSTRPTNHVSARHCDRRLRRRSRGIQAAFGAAALLLAVLAHLGNMPASQDFLRHADAIGDIPGFLRSRRTST
eukprot:1533122-Rhodomonas_salina.2